MAAFVLHHAPVMRLAYLLSMTMLVFAALADEARAQQSSAPGSCTGMFGGTPGIAFKDSSGNFQTVQSATVPYVYGKAECDCATQDLFLDVQLQAPAIPSGSTGTAEVWVGTGCDMAANRTNINTSLCEKVATPDFTLFIAGSGTSGGNHIDIPIPSLSLFSPVKHMCTTNANNRIYLLIFTGQNSNTQADPYGSCTLNVNENVQGIGAPSSAKAMSGDGAVTVTWGQPAAPSPGATFFQVLCADAAGNPVFSSPAQPAYSTCVDGVIQRRSLPTGGSLPSGSTPDGGTTSSAPLTTDSLPAPAPFDVPDGGTDDGGTDAGTSPDGGTTAMLPAPFTQLDRRFICSDQLGPTATSVRIGGLTNGTAYQFVVLAVDQYGNATPATNVIPAKPQRVEDLYNRYRDAGGTASGFCFIATAAYGSYEHRYVKILRRFRDEVLLQSSAGGALVDWYYRHSPPAARFIADHPTARLATQVALWPVIGASAAWLYLVPWQRALLCALVVVWFARKRILVATRRS
jgi:hypothetical protein